jgi:hypothetical protein
LGLVASSKYPYERLIPFLSLTGELRNHHQLICDPS